MEPTGRWTGRYHSGGWEFRGVQEQGEPVRIRRALGRATVTHRVGDHA